MRNKAGRNFEMQFNIPHNMIVKHRMHKYYKIAQDSGLSSDERRLARKKIDKISKGFEFPKDIERLNNIE